MTKYFFHVGGSSTFMYRIVGKTTIIPIHRTAPIKLNTIMALGVKMAISRVDSSSPTVKRTICQYDGLGIPNIVKKLTRHGWMLMGSPTTIIITTIIRAITIGKSAPTDVGGSRFKKIPGVLSSTLKYPNTPRALKIGNNIINNRYTIFFIRFIVGLLICL
jgi:hypothetical protein